MAKHKFDGDWHYFDVDDFDFPPRPPSADGQIHLNIDDDGQGHGPLKPGSQHHNPNDLTGDAFPSRISMVEQANGFVIAYEGHLIFEQGNHMCMVGTWKAISSPLLTKGRRRRRDDGQADGTWVMTKP